MDTFICHDNGFSDENKNLLINNNGRTANGTIPRGPETTKKYR